MQKEVVPGSKGGAMSVLTKVGSRFLCLFFVQWVCLSASAVTLGWTASSSANVVGYNVYYGPSSRNYTNTVDAGTDTTAAITGLVSGATYYFAVTAYTASGMESDYSSEVSYTVPTTNQPPTLNGIVDIIINEDAGQLCARRCDRVRV